MTKRHLGRLAAWRMWRALKLRYGQMGFALFDRHGRFKGWYPENAEPDLAGSDDVVCSCPLSAHDLGTLDEFVARTRRRIGAGDETITKLGCGGGPITEERTPGGDGRAGAGSDGDKRRGRSWNMACWAIALGCLWGFLHFSGNLPVENLLLLLFFSVTAGRYSTQGLWSALRHKKSLVWYAENAVPICEWVVILVLILAVSDWFALEIGLVSEEYVLFMRAAVFGFPAILAFLSLRTRRTGCAVALIAAALLFNPFVRIDVMRRIWEDVTRAIMGVR
jgi:hypothetical protein